MRNPERIKPFLAELERLWLKYPDWRFGQLALILVGPRPQDFYQEDDVVLAAIKRELGDEASVLLYEYEGWAYYKDGSVEKVGEVPHA